MSVELQQHFFTSSVDGLGAAAGFQSVAASADLSAVDIRRIESFCAHNLATMGDEASTFPASFTYFRLEANTFGVSRVVPTGADVFGKPGNYLAHTLIIDLKSFRHLGSNCFKLIAQPDLFSDTCTRRGHDVPPLQTDIQAADDFNWLEPLTSVPSEAILVALINAGVKAHKDERPVVIVPPDPDAGFKILRALLLCMPLPLRETISLSTYRRNHYDAQVTWMAVGDDPASQVSEAEAKYHTYYFNFLDNKFSGVEESCQWGQLLAPLILDRDFKRVGEIVAMVPPFDLNDAVAALNRVVTKVKPGAPSARKTEEGPAGPDLGQLVDALGKTEPGRKMLGDRFQQYMAAALKTDQAPTILALARAIARCIPRVEDEGLQILFSRLVGVTVEDLLRGGHIAAARGLLDDIALLTERQRSEINALLVARGMAAVRQTIQTTVCGRPAVEEMTGLIDLVSSVLVAMPSTELGADWFRLLIDTCSREGWIGPCWESVRNELETALMLIPAIGRRGIMESVGMGLIAGGLLNEYPDWLIVHWLPTAIESRTGVVSGLQEIGFFNYVVATASQDVFLALLDGLRKHPEEIPDFFRSVFSVAEADPTGRLRQICLDSIEEDPARMDRDYQLLLQVLSQAGEFAEYKKVFLVNWLPWILATSEGLVKKLQLVGYREVVLGLRDPGLINSIHRELRQRASELYEFHALLYEIALDDPTFERWVKEAVPELVEAFIRLRPQAQARREQAGRQGSRGLIKGVIEKLRDAYERDPEGFPASLVMLYTDLLGSGVQTLVEQQGFLLDSVEQFTNDQHPSCGTLLRLHQEIVRRGMEEELAALLPVVAAHLVTRREFLDRPPLEQNEYLEVCLRSFPDDTTYPNWLDLCSELYDLDQILSSTPPQEPRLPDFACFLNYQDEVPSGLLKGYIDKALALFSGRNNLKVTALGELINVFDLEAWPDLLEKFMKIYVNGINWANPNLNALAELVSFMLSDTSNRRRSLLAVAPIFLVRMQANALRDLQNLLAFSLEINSTATDAWNEAVEEEITRRKSQGVLGLFRRKAAAPAPF